MAYSERLRSQQFVPPDSGLGRSIEELVRTDERLSGAESQRLRTYCSSNSLEPGRDLDRFGQAVMMGHLDALKGIYEERLAHFRTLATDEEAARSTAMKEISLKRWGPTREEHHKIARWLIEELKVPVDGMDFSGSTALHHAISTKPAFEPEYAQILYNAGGNVNHRDRYGGTPAHEQVMTWDPRDKAVVRRAATALKWYLDHGGNIDMKDTDGKSPRSMVDSTRRLAQAGLRMDTWTVVDDEDRRRQRLAGQICNFCGRAPSGNAALLTCSACRTAKYCASSCQKGDWPHHKLRCKKVSA
ncbi:hypothetical protein BV20DRAFT_1125987 [Pilatotrama ljubarskyi]|nr:hypothetical protein BV20DRAFT_1125987 [Pilatotrama ljubarskyi]